jgi:DNA-binding LacI/PurR family transcriptional regulator
MAQPTIKDIARKLGLSPSTVSRALNDHPDISRETKRRVQETADAFDYHPNSIAQSLQSKRSNIIGVVVPQVKHVFFAQIMAGITDIAYDAGYTVMICQSNDDYEREELNIKALISQRVDGLLISISQSTDSHEHFNQLLKQGIPLVFFDRVSEKVNASKVVVDDFDGAFHAVEYLIQRGYRKIGHLGGPDFLNISQDRYKGYEAALKKHGFSVQERMVIHIGLNEEHGTEGMARLLEQATEMPDAVFCVDDPVAIGAYSHLRAKGLSIPGDIALVGFSDSPIASLVDPPLTTVRQPAYEIGRRATELLLEQLGCDEADRVPRREILKTELIIRQST